MEHNTFGDQTGPLEERLRSMILSNVTTDSTPPNQEGKLPQRGRNWRQQKSQKLENADNYGPNIGNNTPQAQAQGKTQGSVNSPLRGSQRKPRSGRSGWGQSEHDNVSQHAQLYAPRRSRPAPGVRNDRSNLDKFLAQSQFLEHIASQELPPLEMPRGEIEFKHSFRLHLSRLCQQAAVENRPNNATKLELICFGSLGSGFALPGSDMDLALVSSRDDPSLPRLLQKTLLNNGYGARLLTRTRVPILKICEQPGAELLTALREDRQKWDELTPEEKERFDRTGSAAEEKPEEQEESEEEGGQKKAEGKVPDLEAPKGKIDPKYPGKSPEMAPKEGRHDEKARPKPRSRHVKNEKTWYREKRLGPLDFPKTGVGVQCDINFANPLGIQNTALLRCYSYCDVRVRLIIVFVKSWASRRKINSSYSGTLSSYGYVLMVLHYLVNVAQPPVCPNLQLSRRNEQFDSDDPNNFCRGYDVRFWRNEAEIQALAAKGVLTHNRQPLGELLQEFFFYYAKQGHDVPKGGFAWTHAVLSLRSPSGIVTKKTKGWTGARVTYEDKREIRHRYLFAIEDPFEIDHNVARTVTHNGIVAIRDEFRRAWRILCQVGNGQPIEGELFEQLVSLPPLQPLQGDAADPELKTREAAPTESPAVVSLDTQPLAAAEAAASSTAV